jgi:hypothetical protein
MVSVAVDLCQQLFRSSVWARQGDPLRTSEELIKHMKDVFLWKDMLVLVR